MIYKPYNVYPHNSSIDATERNTFSFIFSGDSLTYMDYHFYDTSDNSLVRRAYVPLKFQNTFNDYNVGTIMGANSFKNGHKYKYKMNLYQARADIFAVQGTVRSITEVSLSDKTFLVSSIGSGAFGECGKISSVILPNSIKSVCNFSYRIKLKFTVYIRLT